MATKARITADEYYPITVEGDRTQLVEGEIVVPQPKVIHAGEVLTSPQLRELELSLDELFRR